jgi:hypothetical protein
MCACLIYVDERGKGDGGGGVVLKEKNRNSGGAFLNENKEAGF